MGGFPLLVLNCNGALFLIGSIGNWGPINPVQLYEKKNQGVFVKHYRYNKVEKAIFSFKVKVKVIDLGVIWKGIISGVCMPNMKSLSYGSKVVVKV